MNFGLEGKVALVLGASKGLGRASAQALANEGARVAIGARTPHELEQAAREIQQSSGSQVIAVPVDVTRNDEAAAMVDTAVRQFGRIDILVTNAGGPPFGLFRDFEDTHWQAAFELSLLSVVRFIRLVLPHMRKTGSGRIINITSLSVKQALESTLLATSMRMGVVALAKSLSSELGPDQITVNNVASGIILTDRLRQRPGVKELIAAKADQGLGEAEALQELAADIPLGRVGQPEELAALVAFLASERASYITSTTILVDGGFVRAY